MIVADECLNWFETNAISGWGVEEANLKTGWMIILKSAQWVQHQLLSFFIIILINFCWDIAKLKTGWMIIWKSAQWVCTSQPTSQINGFNGQRTFGNDNWFRNDEMKDLAIHFTNRSHPADDDEFELEILQSWLMEMAGSALLPKIFLEYMFFIILFNIHIKGDRFLAICA